MELAEWKGHTMDELITPRMTIDNYTTRKGITIDDIGVGPVVVISWGGGVIQSLAHELGAQPSEHWLYVDRQPFFTGKYEGKRFSLAQLPVGAPGTIMIMEELIACGARCFIGLGWAGSLQPDAPIGTLLIPTSCISEEGTSLHYLNRDVSPAPDTSLVELLEESAQAEGLKVVKGPLWTTDAPYRELRTKVSRYREQGVLGVDMETSAMYALGLYRAVRVCNLLVVSDELGVEWVEAFGTERLQQATNRAQQVISRFLRSEQLSQPPNS
jgi:uridine phosphorylase